MQAVASFPGPISLPPLSADRFTHSDFGKASPAEVSACWWSGIGGLYPSPPMSDFATPPARPGSPNPVHTISSYSSGHPPSTMMSSSADHSPLSPFSTVFSADSRSSGHDSSHHAGSPSSAAQSFALGRSLPQPEISFERKFSSSSSQPAALSYPTSRNDSFVSSAPTEGASPASSKAAALQTQRGRKAKAHVQSACANCKKAHLACDVQRPCHRCISNGKIATCVDVEHKKRGRPRLRDHRGNKTAAATRYPPSQPLQLNLPTGAREIRPSLRSGQFSGVLASQDPYARQFGTELSYGSSANNSFFNPGFNSSPPPVAFLDTDLKVVKANDPFRAYFPGMQLEGQKLFKMIDASNWGTLEYIQRQIKDERQAKDNTYLPSLIPGHEARDMPEIDVDYINQFTAPFIDRTQSLNFRFVSGQTQSLTVSIRLAKATSFFVVVRIVPPSLSEDPLYSSTASYFTQPATSYPSYSQHSGYSSGYSLAAGPAPQTVESYASSAGSQSPFYGMQSVTSPAGMTSRDATYNFMSNQNSASRNPSSLYYGQGGMVSNQNSMGSSSAEPRSQPHFFNQDMTGHSSHVYGNFSQQHQQQQQQQQQQHQTQAQPRESSSNVSTYQLPSLAHQIEDPSHQRSMGANGMGGNMQYMSMMAAQRPSANYSYGSSGLDEDQGREKRRRLDIPGLAQHLGHSETFSENSREMRTNNTMPPPMI